MYVVDAANERKNMEHINGRNTLNDCIKRADDINNHRTPVSGCLAGAVRNSQNASQEDILTNREPWAPKRRDRPPVSNRCTSTQTPFCTALSKAEAERLAPQYIALQKCSPATDAGYIVDATSTCAVLVIGAGGLGSPLLMYLAAGGVGIIGIMDGDVVEVSNLHRYSGQYWFIWSRRQIIHDEDNRGMNKAISAKNRMSKINSKGAYFAYECFFGAEEADAVLPLYDIIVDATDNPQTRYLINDACVKYNKTLVIASSIGTQGQLMVFNRASGVAPTPCYRCICPLEDNPFITSIRGACSFAGVLGTIPGLFGCLQATEVLKLAAGLDDAVLAPGHMLLYETTDVTRPFRCVKLMKNPRCIACGDEPKIDLKMMPFQCSTINVVVDAFAISGSLFWQLYMENMLQSVPVKCKLDFDTTGPIINPDGEEYLISLVDVRPREHYNLCHLTGAVSWPVSDISDDLAAGSLILDVEQNRELLDVPRYIGRLVDYRFQVFTVTTDAEAVGQQSNNALATAQGCINHLVGKVSLLLRGKHEPVNRVEVESVHNCGVQITHLEASGVTNEYNLLVKSPFFRMVIISRPSLPICLSKTSACSSQPTMPKYDAFPPRASSFNGDHLAKLVEGLYIHNARFTLGYAHDFHDG
ncbi:adenylyltransferase and sulfurtransferase MOCS3 [Babesia ovis]|uniref:Adenylyltransferase and sulfurtransferase MOCS3 n=1 Tax=Babesia ovis TaxID=5869 RepID=A0A9W5WU67_BABOV|nr:adenylyltransferase and sulfurtransferase MOCS3 [Babesia ovis]